MCRTQSKISLESISQMVSNIDTNIKAELDPIKKLVLQLPTNALCDVQVSEGGKMELGVSSSNVVGNNFGVFREKDMSTQIPTTISMKTISSISTSTTTTTTKL